MTLWSRIRSWTRTIFHRARAESEMDAELRFHIEAHAEELVRGGVSREEALRHARVEFGGIERVKEEGREARGVQFFDELLQDLRLRRARSPEKPWLRGRCHSHLGSRNRRYFGDLQRGERRFAAPASHE